MYEKAARKMLVKLTPCDEDGVVRKYKVLMAEKRTFH